MGLIAYFRGLFESATRIHRMVRTLKLQDEISENDTNGSVMRRAYLRCNTCEQPGACENWLENHETAKEAPAYCRNRDLFARLTARIEAETAA